VGHRNGELIIVRAHQTSARWPHREPRLAPPRLACPPGLSPNKTFRNLKTKQRQARANENVLFFISSSACVCPEMHQSYCYAMMAATSMAPSPPLMMMMSIIIIIIIIVAIKRDTIDEPDCVAFVVPKPHQHINLIISPISMTMAAFVSWLRASGVAQTGRPLCAMLIVSANRNRGQRQSSATAAQRATITD
jgi:hypothetical protein